jgi:prevent-host-death family protein
MYISDTTEMAMTAMIDMSAPMYTGEMADRPEIPEELPIFKARNQLGVIIENARYFDGVTYLTNRGKRVAAVVSIELAEVAIAVREGATLERITELLSKLPKS